LVLPQEARTSGRTRGEKGEEWATDQPRRRRCPCAWWSAGHHGAGWTPTPPFAVTASAGELTTTGGGSRFVRLWRSTAAVWTVPRWRTGDRWEEQVRSSRPTEEIRNLRWRW
jgi:hypothetical protein